MKTHENEIASSRNICTLQEVNLLEVNSMVSSYSS